MKLASAYCLFEKIIFAKSLAYHRHKKARISFKMRAFFSSPTNPVKD
jgi:hypothetical protein